MGGWGWLVILATLAMAPPKNGPPYSATDEPPPRGQPSPRVGEMQPPPPQSSQIQSDVEQRFPTLEGQLRKERAARAAGTPTGRVELHASRLSRACDGVAPDERLQCPLRDPKKVASLTDVPDGVRVGLRTGVIEPDRLQHLFDCQRSLVIARPQTPAPCPYYDARTDHAVIVTEGQTAVLFRRPDDPDQLRGQVRAALARPAGNEQAPRTDLPPRR